MIQKARIRTAWKNKDKKVSIPEFANALSAICWRMSLNAAKNLHQQDFDYETDEQRLGVIQQYLFFFIHCADRLMFDHFDQKSRSEFINALSADCENHFATNALEISGKRVDSAEFITALNQNMGKLSMCRFIAREPGYEMYRALGSEVQGIMGHSQTNKWVIDQVMDIDAPEAYEFFRKSFDKLRKSSQF
ncbi:MAG: hypothetical protein ACR2QW_02490 [bacterium]